MTNEEAIEKITKILYGELKKLPHHYDEELKDDVYENIKDVDDILVLNKIVRSALENQNKYRWHDLTKNPNDFPNDDNVEYVICVEYQNGKRECTVGCLDMGGDMMLLPTLGNWIGNSYHIIAWREIEPFKERN